MPRSCRRPRRCRLPAPDTWLPSCTPFRRRCRLHHQRRRRRHPRPRRRRFRPRPRRLRHRHRRPPRPRRRRFHPRPRRLRRHRRAQPLRHRFHPRPRRLRPRRRRHAQPLRRCRPRRRRFRRRCRLRRRHRRFPSFRRRCRPFRPIHLGRRPCRPGRPSRRCRPGRPSRRCRPGRRPLSRRQRERPRRRNRTIPQQQPATNRPGTKELATSHNLSPKAGARNFRGQTTKRSNRKSRTTRVPQRESRCQVALSTNGSSFVYHRDDGHSAGAVGPNGQETCCPATCAALRDSEQTTRTRSPLSDPPMPFELTASPAGNVAHSSTVIRWRAVEETPAPLGARDGSGSVATLCLCDGCAVGISRRLRNLCRRHLKTPEPILPARAH